jgi:glucose-1-phosphate cytidylyltransferase
MALYAAHGLTDFVLLLGHGADQVQAFADSLDEPWRVNCIDTGLDTPTGGRVARAADLLSEGTFCVTYADGVADIDLRKLLAFHSAHGRLATMTVVQPVNQWGVARLGDDGRITGFEEKPRLESWVNGGFLVMEPGALELIGESEVLEREPFERLSQKGELYAYRHEGFWDCMDTYKDTLMLNELWEAGRAPWRTLVGA